MHSERYGVKIVWFVQLFGEAMMLREEVQKVVDEVLNPALRMHGGGVEVVDVDDNEGVVKVRLIGACHG